MIYIEFQYVRIYINSLAVQAIVERTLSKQEHANQADNVLRSGLEPSSMDYEYVQQVVDGSRAILQAVLDLSRSGHLRYAPVRTFLRITSASIFLLKVRSKRAISES
jgi:hypothetical protein